MKKLVKGLILGLLVLLFQLSLQAQTSTGRLSGTVSGPDGVLPGATVVVTDNTTGKETTVVTDAEGGFLVPQLDFGTYTVKVTAQGFKTYIAQELKIDVGRDYKLEPKLEVGDVSASVTVTAGADIITASTPQISNTVSPQQILSLPLITRNPLELTRLQSGTQSNQFQNTTINGVRTSFTNITRDGINIQDSFIRTNATDFAPGRPSVDDTAEFTVITSNQEADQGYGSAQIRLVTPRGTKDFHGALFAYNRNSEFSANSFFGNRAGKFVATDPLVLQGLATVGTDRTPRPFRNRNQFGGKVSGPMPVPGFNEGGPFAYMHKGFFFFSYEKIIDPLSALATRTILTPGARGGQFQYTRATFGPAINTTLNGANITCPATTANNTGTCTISNILLFAGGSNLPNTNPAVINGVTGLPGRPIPTTISPVILARILGPMPTTSNTTGGDLGLNTNGFQINRKSNQERSTYTSRIDVDINDKNSINGVYSYNFETNLRPDVDTNGYGVDPQADQIAKNKTLSLSWRKVISANIVNEARAGLFFSDVPFRRIVDTPAFMLSVPLITSPETNFTDQGRTPRYSTLQDNVDWIAGRHNLRFGGQLQFYKINSYNFGNGIPTTTPGWLVQTNTTSSPFFAAGNFGAFGGISTAQVGTANGLLALLAGITVQGQLRYNLPDGTATSFEVGPNITPFKYSNHALYFSDRWQINNNLTVTAGVRYELFPALKLGNNLSVEPVIHDTDNFIPDLLNKNGTYDIIGTNSGELGTYHKTDFNNFAPSIGVAWAPNFEKGIGKFLFGNTVIRGGFSRAFGNDQLVTAMSNATGQNVGLASRTGTPLSPTGNTLLNFNIGFDPFPAFATPAFVPPPFSYLRNQSSGISGVTPFFGTVFAVDPKLQIPSVDQYSVGYQREFGSNTAFEIRYVGTRSDNFVRGVDLNQIDIFSNGFAADFNRAIANAQISNGNPFCGFTPTVGSATPGCVPLTIMRPSGAYTFANTSTLTNQTVTYNVTAPGPGILVVGTGGLAGATFNTPFTSGQPGETAFTFISNGFNNHPTLANVNALPFVNFVPNPGTGAVDVMLNDARFRYHSVQLEFRRRFSKGLYFQANYTFSKNLTNAIGSINSPASGQSLFEPYLDNNNKQLDYTRADFDQTHVFNFNGIYALPMGKGKSFMNYGGFANTVFGGWEISGLVQWASGGPITFTDTRGTLNRAARSTRQTPNSTLTYAQLRSMMGVFEANGNIYWIDPSIINAANGTAAVGYIHPGVNTNSTFAGQVFFAAEPGQTGNQGRFIVNGPKNFNINTALLKNIAFGGENSMRLQLRIEAFNLLNNTNFNANSQLTGISSTTFGRITSAGASRTIQFAARFEF